MPTSATSFTAAALPHLRAMARAVASRAPSLQRRFGRDLAANGHDPQRQKAFLSITPASAALLLAARRPIDRFLELVAYSGRRLAKLNVPPEEAAEVLSQADLLLDEVAENQFRPTREQLQLVTLMAVNQAYFDVREGEAQAFFGLARAEADARDVPDMLQRFGRVLARAMRARASSLSLVESLPAARRRPRYLSGAGKPLDSRLVKPGSSYWSFPIPAGKDFGGVIELSFTGPFRWLPREEEMMRDAARRCGRAIERAQLIEQVVRLSVAARRAEEEERSRLGRELHDETAQSLLALRLEMEMFEREVPVEWRPRIARLRESVERNVVDLRRIIAALSPAMLERLGLEAAVRQLCERTGRTSGLRVRGRLSVAGGSVSPEASQAVYRIAQESLQNVMHHSQASEVNVRLRIADKEIRLNVVDNGVGFDAGGASGKPMSFGLAGMRERASLVGGTLRIRSAPGKGTAVLLEVPRTAETVTNDQNSSISHR